MSKKLADDDEEEDYTLLVKNLDTGETLDIEEASIKFSVMGLDHARLSIYFPFLSYLSPLVRKRRINQAVSLIFINKYQKKMKIIILMHY